MKLPPEEPEFGPWKVVSVAALLIAFLTRGHLGYRGDWLDS